MGIQDRDWYRAPRGSTPRGIWHARKPARTPRNGSPGMRMADPLQHAMARRFGQAVAVLIRYAKDLWREIRNHVG